MDFFQRVRFSGTWTDPGTTLMMMTMAIVTAIEMMITDDAVIVIGAIKLSGSISCPQDPMKAKEEFCSSEMKKSAPCLFLLMQYMYMNFLSILLNPL